MEKFDMGADMVAVYVPQAYNFAGQLYILPREKVRKIEKITSGEAMKYAVTGGVVDLDEERRSEGTRQSETDPDIKIFQLITLFMMKKNFHHFIFITACTAMFLLGVLCPPKNQLLRRIFIAAGNDGVVSNHSIDFLAEHAVDPDKRRYAVPEEGPGIILILIIMAIILMIHCRENGMML